MSFEYFSILSITFNEADKLGGDCFQHLQETLHSMEGNSFKYELKVEQRKAIRQLLEGRDLPAILPTGYEKLHMLDVRRAEARNFACLLVIMPLTSIVEIEAMNFPAFNNLA